jgi:hypothetical protein
MIKEFLHIRNIDYIYIPFRNIPNALREMPLESGDIPRTRHSKAMFQKEGEQNDTHRVL